MCVRLFPEASPQASVGVGSHAVVPAGVRVCRVVKPAEVDELVDVMGV